jgi:uncharacterized membrane protein
MSRILEAVLSAFLELVAFFDNIKARQSDDEITARYRYLQRACVWAGFLCVLAVLFSVLAVNLVEALDSVFQHASTLESLRSSAFVVVMTAFAASSSYAVFCGWRLWRFLRDEGMV